jgi:hypothetical protein
MLRMRAINTGSNAVHSAFPPLNRGAIVFSEH